MLLIKAKTEYVHTYTVMEPSEKCLQLGVIPQTQSHNIYSRVPNKPNANLLLRKNHELIQLIQFIP